MTSPLPSRDQVFVHFYRAVVGHMDVWRQRMDATTNWAVATSAAMISFAFTTVDAPHFIILLALSFDAMFLFMESRRYQVFDLWRRRFRTLNHYLIAPTLTERDAPPPEVLLEHYADIAVDLGRTIPHLSLKDAIGYRLRRNYGYLFGVGILAWLLKLEVHPIPTRDLTELMQRAVVGVIPGYWIVAGVLTLIVIATVLAVRAPSEGMLGWSEVPSPLGRWLARSRKLTPRNKPVRATKRKPGS